MNLVGFLYSALAIITWATVLVHQYRKKGYTIPDAQERAYSLMWSEEIPFD